MNGIQLREVFDTVAALYDRARPRYPSALFDDLAELTGIRSGARVLEIGPGTGQATLTLATRGYSITAVELGRHLAAHARDKMASFAGVQIENADFETWPLPAEPFDLVFAATAFHWIGREVGERKSAGALREGGALAVVTTTHVADDDEDFWIGIQGCYERHVPGTKPGRRLPRIDGVRDVCDEIGVTGWFESPVLRQVLVRHELYHRAVSRSVAHPLQPHRARAGCARVTSGRYPDTRRGKAEWARHRTLPVSTRDRAQARLA